VFEQFSGRVKAEEGKKSQQQPEGEEVSRKPDGAKKSTLHSQVPNARQRAEGKDDPLRVTDELKKKRSGGKTGCREADRRRKEGLK